MMNGYIMTGHVLGSNAPRDYVFGLQDKWLPVSQIVNPEWQDDGMQSDPDEKKKSRYLANPDEATIKANEEGAKLYLDRKYSIQQIREIQGETQSRYTNWDVRMSRVEVEISFIFV